MKKRILSMALAFMMLVMIPAETAMAMQAAIGNDAAVITLAEESAEEAVDEDETTPEENEETTETEEVVEEPAAEPEETEGPTVEPTAEPEVTEEPTVEPEATEEPVVEPEVTAEPTEEPVVEPEVTEEPTVEPEATEEPVVESEATEEPIEEATEEPTEEPAETPEVTLPEKQDVKFDGRDLTAKVVGSDGVRYDNVEYLSLQAVNSLSSEGVDAYIRMCDDIAALQKTGEGIEKAVLYLNEDGEIGFSITVSTNLLFSADVQNELIEGLVEEKTEASTAESYDVEMAEVEEGEKEETLEATVEVEVAENDVEVERNAESETVTRANNIEDTDVVIEENVELAKTCEIPAEIVTDVVAEDIDTKMSNANYFKNQLSSSEKLVWNAGYSAMVKGGKNSFSFKGGYLFFETVGRGISALNITYPNSFNWMQPGGVTNMRGSYYRGKYNYTVTIEKSKHYTSSLEKKAQAKVKTLVKAAKADAAKNYPGNYVYGMVKYFDWWIRENNYYNNIGTNSEKQKTKGYYYCHSCYGILLEGYGVCESYALAMTRLLDAAGIRNVYVTGYAGGGHAWNYVQMPNGSWYLLDTTWNDNDYPADDCFLIGSSADGGTHRAHGYMYSYWSYGFTYPSLASANYNATTEKTYLDAVTFEKTTLGVKKGGSTTIKVKKPSGSSNYYFSKYPISWKSSNTAIATVSKTGKVTGVNPGSATITYTVAGVSKTCTVYVYQFTGNKFTDNNKTSYSYTYLSADTAFDSRDVFKKNITVAQKNPSLTAAQLISTCNVKAPTVKSSNTKVATATAALSGNTIVLTVTPKKVGTATITVSFGGKTSTLKLTNKYNIATNAGWFDYSKIVNQTYKGTAYKPAVKKTATAPKNLKYTVSYKNNINAGTATVTIKGTGNYAGTITQTFVIKPKYFGECKFTASTMYKTYNGKAQKAVTTVKDGKKVLKAGRDYEVLYNGSLTVPVKAGTYKVTVRGIGNYKTDRFTLSAPNDYVIKKLAIGKATISCPKEVKWKNGKTIEFPVKVKAGKSVLVAGTDYDIKYYKVGSTTPLKQLTEKGKYEAVITPKGTDIDWGNKEKVVKKFTIKKM